VVATIFNQLLEDRTGPNAVNGLVYLVGLDELNRFAPRGAKDAITKLIETVAAEMRSAGIILLGAQQQASKVSERVFENAGIHVIGRSGSLEMSQPMWRFMSEKMRAKAAILQADEKLLVQDSFREPMHVRVPFPVWAMRPGEVQTETSEVFGFSNDDNPPAIITY
jgi:DNA helicase HerA-like ATPase